jgi:hypothetical protein
MCRFIKGQTHSGFQQDRLECCHKSTLFRICCSVSRQCDYRWQVFCVVAKVSEEISASVFRFENVKSIFLQNVGAKSKVCNAHHPRTPQHVF